MDGPGHQQHSDRHNLCPVGAKRPKVCHKTLHHQPKLLTQGRMDPCFHVVEGKFRPYDLSVAAEIESH